jgi:uncharacterized damage-inducible protein DinB
MTVEEFFLANAAHTAHQIDVVFRKFTGDQWDTKLVPEAMSPRETLAHLCDCYQCASQRARGEEPAWGSFKPEDDDPARLEETRQRLRAKAIEEAVAVGDHALLAELYAYLHEHEAYHVGQLCLLVVRLDPAWDPYSIYLR